MDLGWRNRAVGAQHWLAAPRSCEDIAAARRSVGGHAMGAGGLAGAERRGHLVGAAGRKLGARRTLAGAGPGRRPAIFFAGVVRSVSAVSLLPADRRVQPAAVAG